MKSRLLLGAGTGLLASPGLLLAQAAYPNKPIRYIVPVAPGGGSDMVGRTVTERWGKQLNQTFVVDNQAGGGGVIACQVTAKAPGPLKGSLPQVVGSGKLFRAQLLGLTEARARDACQTLAKARLSCVLMPPKDQVASR